MLQGKRMGEEHGLCLTQLLQGAEECWSMVLDVGSVGQQQLSCPAQSWGCAVLTVQLWAGHTGGSAGSSTWRVRGVRANPLPALALLCCSGGPWGCRDGGEPHTAQCAVLLEVSQAGAGTRLCSPVTLLRDRSTDQPWLCVTWTPETV